VPPSRGRPGRVDRVVTPTLHGRKRPLRYGLSLRIGTAAPPAEVLARIAGFERAGLDSTWMGQLFGIDTLMLYAAAGRDTSTISLGTAVVPTYSRHPLVLASQALTAQALTGNRIVLGIGSSHAGLVRDTMGIEYERPAQYLREYLQVLRPALDGAPIDHAGRMLRVSTGALGATGIPGAGRVPVVVGTFSPKSLVAAAELADGVMTWLAGPGVLGGEVRPTIDDAAAAAGRARPRLVAGLPIAVTDDPARERAAVARFLGPFVRFPAYEDVFRREGIAGPEDLALVGTEAEIVDRLGELAALGVTDFYGGCSSDDEATIERTVGLLGELARGRTTSEPSWPAA
jgi:5,10-methylenetetrahydromethanopterin reductase